MTPTEITITALGALGTLTGTGGALAVWLRSRGSVAVAREQGAADALPHVMERLTATERRLDGVAVELDRSKRAAEDYARMAREAADAARRCEEHRAHEAAACEERIADVETSLVTEISALKTRLAERDADVTRRVRLEVRRTLSPPPAGYVIAQPERTPKKTIRPPDEGGEET